MGEFRTLDRLDMVGRKKTEKEPVWIMQGKSVRKDGVITGMVEYYQI